MPISIIWFISVLCVLFQFSIQLSSGVIIDAVGQDLKLSALDSGILSGSFYYIYAALQIPVGLIFDFNSTRFWMMFGTFVCALGCFCFAISQNFYLLIIARLITGSGAAFAFVGLSHILRRHFALKHFAFMIGFSEIFVFLARGVATISLGLFIEQLGWRFFLHLAAWLGFIIALLSGFIIPKTASQPISVSPFKALQIILKSKRIWLNGLYVSLTFSVITVFGSMWAVPFLQLKLNCSLQQASVLDAMIFCGAGVSCPLFGYLAISMNRQRLMLISCFATLILLMLLLFVPNMNFMTCGFLMFGIGLCCGAYMLSYAVANDLSPPYALSTCAGFTNTMAIISAPLMQFIIGVGIDKLPFSTRLLNFQCALVLIPLSLLGAALIVMIAFTPTFSNLYQRIFSNHARSF
ncbi:MAG TPA: MFS transporter [Legionellales bacterium]|nr:MFS transporter [Legionellales bacterium]